MRGRGQRVEQRQDLLDRPRLEIEVLHGVDREEHVGADRVADREDPLGLHARLIGHRVGAHLEALITAIRRGTRVVDELVQ